MSPHSVPAVQESAIVTGGSSTLGDVVLPRLVYRFQTVFAVVRSQRAYDCVRSVGAEPVWWDMSQGGPAPQLRATHMVHMAGIRKSAAALDLAQSAGVQYMIAISSASASAKGHPNQEWILSAELAVSEAPIASSILRPTMIYGSPRDRNVRRLHALLIRSRLAPLLVGGGYIMPVLADDLASAIEECIDRGLVGIRPVAGPSPMRLGTLVSELAQASGVRQMPIPIPVKLLSWAAKRITWSSGRNVHALQMLGLDRVVDSPINAGFNYSPTSLEGGLAIAVSRYRTGHVDNVAPHA